MYFVFFLVRTVRWVVTNDDWGGRQRLAGKSTFSDVWLGRNCKTSMGPVLVLRDSENSSIRLLHGERSGQFFWNSNFSPQNWEQCLSSKVPSEHPEVSSFCVKFSFTFRVTYFVIIFIRFFLKWKSSKHYTCTLKCARKKIINLERLL